jgi:hypothetical protein
MSSEILNATMNAARIAKETGYQQGRRDAARDLRQWIGDHHRPIKGIADVPVDEMYDVVEGKLAGPLKVER